MALPIYIHSPGLRTIVPVVKKPPIKPVVHNPYDPVAGSGTAPPPNPYPDFYPYKDYYGDILTQLASLRDAQLAGLKSDLEGRNNAVQGIVDAQRAPLNSNYSTAIQEAAAVNDAVANRLNAQGGAATTDLKSQLAALGQDPNAATADLSKYYSGLGGANYAMDSGDVQRLIGRQAEENTLLNKQPDILRGQNLQAYTKDASDILTQDMQSELGIKQSQAQDRQAYDQAKFQYDSGVAKSKQDQINQNIQAYNDNYWKNQDLLFKKWQTQIATGDKKAADATRKQIAQMQIKAQTDIANIKANTSTTNAYKLKNVNINGHAATFDPSTGTYHYTNGGVIPQSVLDTWAKKAGKGSGGSSGGGSASNVSRGRVYNAALNAVVDPKTGLIRSGVNPTGYNADWTMTRIVNNILKSYGVNPQTAQGRSIISAVLAQANGRKFAAAKAYGLDPNTARYKYDPNWVKGAQAAAAAKHKKKNYNNR